MGPAGTTLIDAKKDLLGKTGKDIPSMLDYQVHSDKESMFNTPLVFATYVSMLNLRWIKRLDLSEIERRNKEKASLLYNAIDNSSLFKGTANREDRSLMNVTFVLENNALESEFNKLLTESNINGLKGHISVGGFRTSIYNALSIDSVSLLTELINDFSFKYVNKELLETCKGLKLVTRAGVGMDNIDISAAS